MAAKRVIITDHLHPYLAVWLSEQGFELDILPDITNEQLLEIIDQYEGLVLSTKILVNPALIDRAKGLEFIARAGSGMENIDTGYARSKGIHVVSSPEGNANSVTEHAMGMLLSLLNNINKADREIRQGIWQREPNRGSELSGRTVGIIGFGHTGSAFAAKLAGFGVTILAYDKFKTGFGSHTVQEVSLSQLQEAADIVSFHVPLTDETFHYFNPGFLHHCKKEIWLINTSRGKVVDTFSLPTMLDSGKLKGAALDVFENERFDHLNEAEKNLMEDFCRRDNMILTPHVAGWTHESHLKLSSVLAEKLAALGIQSVK